MSKPLVLRSRVCLQLPVILNRWQRYKNPRHHQNKIDNHNIFIDNLYYFGSMNELNKIRTKYITNRNKDETNVVPKPELNKTLPKINQKRNHQSTSLVSITIHEFKIAAYADGVKVHHQAYQQRTSSASNTILGGRTNGLENVSLDRRPSGYHCITDQAGITT